MPTSPLVWITIPIVLGLVTVGLFLLYTALRYAPIIGRIFEEKPLFLPLRLAPLADGEDVRLETSDGFTLAGTYHRATTRSRLGVLVFCHEYLSDRWSFAAYAGPLRSLGFDVFAFDFRNHGQSEADSAYRPLQWVTDHEVRDLKAALTYLRGRPDHDPAGFGFFGVSRGGSTALVVAARERDVWGVITDGAFPTSGTMLSYIMRWAEIYVSNPYLWKSMPTALFRYAAWAGRVRSERRLNCRFPSVERAVAQISPRPWLMIHGEKDAYIGTGIARSLFDCGGEPKELWIVPKAKHNRCREMQPEAYAERVAAFFRQFAPRRELPSMVVADEASSEESAYQDRAGQRVGSLTGSAIGM